MAQPLTVQQVIQQMQAQANAQNALIRRLANELSNIKKNGADPFSNIPGRRVWYVLAGTDDFTIANDEGKEGSAINLQVSEDGPFVATHFPVILWRPSAPSNATDYGKWRPVYHGPLPTQQLGNDFISISYSFNDSGSGRNLQSSRVPPIMSAMDRLCPLPFPTIFKRAGILSFTPFYEAIDFSTSPEVDTTQGTLVVALPGYKIVPDADFMGIVP